MRGVQDYKMLYLGNFGITRESYPIDRDVLLFPEILVESYDVKPERVLKPIFDSVWNACGFAKSLNYNENDEWSPQRR